MHRAHAARVPSARIRGPGLSALAQRVSVRDIRDAEGFVAATIARAPMRVGASEREELQAEGLAILVELERGFDGRGRFSGYAARYLPARLGDAWHRWHPEHRRTGTNGHRCWEYGEVAVSLAQLETGAVLEGEGIDAAPALLDDALAQLRPWRRFAARRMAELVAEGARWGEVASSLGVDRATLAELREELRQALAKVEA